jgi:hypothetical protein
MAKLAIRWKRLQQARPIEVTLSIQDRLVHSSWPGQSAQASESLHEHFSFLPPISSLFVFFVSFVVPCSLATSN